MPCTAASLWCCTWCAASGLLLILMLVKARMLSQTGPLQWVSADIWGAPGLET